MTLSSEAQALFDHARNSIPRWLTRGKAAALEWLYGYVTEFDSVRAQGQSWLDITYILQASGANLDQHAKDRGTSRRLNESDVALRLRLINLADAVTQPALKGSIDAILASYSLGPCTFINLRRDRGHYHIPYGNYPVSAVGMNTAVGYGTWSAGWLCDEISGNLAPVFGGLTLTASGSPTYGSAGPQGVDRDKAVTFGNGAAKFDGGSNFDVSGTDDLCVAGIAMFTANPTAPTYGTIVGKVSSGFGNGWAVSGTGGSSYGFFGGSAAANQSFIDSSVTADFYMLNAWHAWIAVLDRGAGKLRFGARRIDTSANLLGGNNNVIAGSWSVADSFSLGASNWVNGNQSYYQAALYVGKGAGVAANMSTNLPTALANFATSIFPKKSTSFMSRGYRMGRDDRLMGYTVILPYGTTAGIASAISDYLRQFGPGGFNYYVEVRANP